MSEIKPRNKVLIVLYYYLPYTSGLSATTRFVAEGLAKAGYEVTVLTSRHEPELAEREVIGGVTVVRRPVAFRLGKGVIMPLFWLDVIRYARQNDYVNCQLPLADTGISSLFIPKHKQVTTYHCDIFLGKELSSRLITAVSNFLMRIQLARSRVVVPSSLDYFEHSRMRRFIGKAQPIHVTVAAPRPLAVQPEELYRRIGVAQGEITIGYVGRVVYEKGIEYLFQSIPFLEKAFTDFKIIILGDYKKVAGGSVKDQLDEYMTRYPGRIIFTGYLDDDQRNAFYAGLDVFVLPSIDPLEAFGMVQIESMLYGTPVVVSDLPGVRIPVQKTGYGRISKLKDPEDIARQIIEVATHRERYLPDPARVLELFGPEKSVALYTELMPK
jgi:glycosyltransferase involved in cell wall biosynthesis